MGRTSQHFKDAQAKRERGGFVPLPFAVIRSQSFAALSGQSVKLLCDLLARIAMNKRTPPELRGRMYAELAQYLYPKRKAVELGFPAARFKPGEKVVEFTLDIGSKPASAAELDKG